MRYVAIRLEPVLTNLPYVVNPTKKNATVAVFLKEITVVHPTKNTVTTHPSVRRIVVMFPVASLGAPTQVSVRRIAVLLAQSTVSMLTSVSITSMNVVQRLPPIADTPTPARNTVANMTTKRRTSTALSLINARMSATVARMGKKHANVLVES
jgi:hypothetical protein